MDIFDEVEYYNNIMTIHEENLNISIPRRALRDSSDPFAMDITNFKRRYRFSQDTVQHVLLPLILPELQKMNQRGLPLAPELQLLVCLRFYASASFQIVCGDLLNVSQPAVSNIVTNISYIIAKKINDYIKYPSNLHRHRLQFTQLGQFGAHAGLQNVDGAIDCTHIKIANTPGVQHHEAYRNRKSYFSINVQAVVGPTGEFLDLVARWAGSTHDSRIFQMSSLNSKYVQGVYTGRLVGDSGYPCLQYLLTPINSPTEPSEELYNKVHSRTRNVVERTFGQWKRRFPCLQRGLGNKLSTVSNIIVACAILYNISKNVNEDPPVDEEFTEVTEEEHTNEPVNASGSADGFAIRASIVDNYR